MGKRIDHIIGFRDEEKLVRAVARRLRATVRLVESDHYPSGELKINVPSGKGRVLVVGDAPCESDRILRLTMLGEGCRANGMKPDLLAPWIAYGRQDRVAKAGETPGGLVVGRMLSEVYGKIATLDAHSDAFVRAFQKDLYNVLPFDERRLLPKRAVTLVVAPDHGARFRARAAAKRLRVPYAVIEKKRTSDGVVAKIDIREKRITQARVLIVDDLTDTGGTLEAAACVLRSAGAASVSALVTHVTDLCAMRKTLKNIDRLDAIHDRATGTLPAAAIDRLIAAIR